MPARGFEELSEGLERVHHPHTMVYLLYGGVRGVNGDGGARTLKTGCRLSGVCGPPARAWADRDRLERGPLRGSARGPCKDLQPRETSMTVRGGCNVKCARVFLLLALVSCGDSESPAAPVTPVVVEPVETRPPPRFGPAGTVLSSTVWQRPGVITSDDPTAFDSLVYVGRGSRGFYSPFPDDRGWRDTLDLFLFDAHFSGGAVMEVQAHPAYGHPPSVRVIADLVLSAIGRMPRILIDGGREVELSPAPKNRAAANGCGKIYHFWGDWENQQTDFLEEVAIHEGSHAVLEDCKSTGCRASPPKYDCPGLAGDQSPEWQAA